MKKILAIAGFAIASVVSASLATCPVMAAGGTCPAGMARDTYENSIAECSVPEDEANPNDLSTTISKVINAVLGILGLIAVVVMILGGITFLTSQGDANKVQKGKNTILYGLVGLIVALLAFAIVNFVMTSVFSGKSGGGESSACKEDEKWDEANKKCVKK